MDPGIQTLIDGIRGAWRFRWAALAVAWAVALSAWVTIFAVPNSYRASARVFVDTETALSEVTKGITVEGDVDIQIQRVRQALLGGPQLLDVAEQGGLIAANAPPRAQQAALEQLQKAIEITGGGGRAGLYVISYRNPSRDAALRVVDRLLRSFVLGSLGGKREGSAQAQRFLTDQIAEYEKRLTEAEERLANFKKRNVGLMPGSQGDYFTSLRAEIEALEKARTVLEVATRRRDEYGRQLRGEDPVVRSGTEFGGRTATSGDPALIAGDSDTAKRIREAQARLDELLLRFTDNHPDVVALRATLVELRRRQDSEIDAARRGDVGAAARAGLAANPVYQSLQLNYKQAGVDVVAAQAEASDHQQRIDKLRALVNTAPGVEAQFARLNRDYDVTRAQYQTLVQRLEQTKLGQEAQQTGIVRFEVLEPPSASLDPVAPNRPVLIMLALFAAIAAGATLAYVLDMWKPVVHTARQLAELTGFPVIGEVGIVWVERYNAVRRRGLALFAGATAALIASGVILELLQWNIVQFLRGTSA